MSQPEEPEKSEATDPGRPAPGAAAGPRPGPTPEDSGGTTWDYGPYHLSPSDFFTAMVHFYRGEVSRSNTWRSRLDNTTNWAVVTTAAVLTFAFSSIEHSHVVILISLLLIFLFLVIEARRYRYYELWALRVRLMETDFFAAMLRSPHRPHEEWSARLVASLLNPEFPISFWEAIGRRLRRNYIWLFTVMGLAWVLKLVLYPAEAITFPRFLEHAALGSIPGDWVFGTVVAFFVFIYSLALFTAGLRASPGEVLTQEQVLGVDLLKTLAKAASEIPFLQKHEQLIIIITDNAQAVADQLMAVVKRGVTALQGVGMYSGTPRSVLFCAVAPQEVDRVKSVVYATDPKAFLVVNPTEEVLGAGFRELRPRWRRGFFSREKPQRPGK
ncbi:MAG: hypothetical protein Kow00109_17000 [Acidobacteriota bacterium]